LGWVGELMGWVESGRTKWTHVQLWLPHSVLPAV